MKINAPRVPAPGASSSGHSRPGGTRWLLLLLLVAASLLGYGTAITAKAPAADSPVPESADQDPAISSPASVDLDAVNYGEFAVTMAADWQSGPDAVYNPSQNEFLIVWQDRRNGSNWDIYGRRISADGLTIGADINICLAAQDQRFPQVAYNSKDNEYLVVWHHRQAGNYRVYGQRLSATGELIGSRFPIPTGTNVQWVPDVEYNSQRNEYLVVWQCTTNANVYAQRVSNSGGLLGSPIAAGTGMSGQWGSVWAAYSRVHDDYLIVWSQLVAGQGDIFGQRLSGDGVKEGGRFTICNSKGDQRASGVAYAPERDRYLIVWTDARNEGSLKTDVYGQLISGDGYPIGQNLVINNGGSWQYAGNVTYNPLTREFYVVWEDGQGTTHNDIRAQRINDSGENVGDRLSVKVRDGNQAEPNAVCDTQHGRYLVVWQDWRNQVDTTPNADIYAQMNVPPQVVPSATPTVTPTGPTRTPTPSFTYTRTPSITKTPTFTISPTGTRSPTASYTPVPRSIYAYQTDRQPFLDGKLGEWELTGERWIGQGACDSIGRSAINGQEDLSANIWVRYDQSFLYLALAVRDDKIVVDSGDAIWHDDSVELSLDGAYDRVNGGTDDHRFTIRADGLMWHFGSGYIPKPGVITSTIGYTIEMAMPLSLLTAKTVAEDTIMGINIGIHDDDDGGEYDTYLIWTADSTNDALKFGRLLFRTAAPTPVPTATPTLPTNTPTATEINTQTLTPTATSVDTAIPTATGTSSAESPTPTSTEIVVLESPTATEAWTPTSTAEASPTATDTQTNEPAATATDTESPTGTSTATATDTATATWTATNTSTVTATSTDTLTSTPESTPTPTASATATLTLSPTATLTPAIVQLTLQQGAQGYTGATDTYISKWQPSANFGSDVKALLRPDVYAYLLRFDLSSIPSNAVIDRAWLRLHLGYGDSHTLDLYRLLAPWSEGEATWQRASAAQAWSAPGATQPGVDRAVQPYRRFQLESGELWRTIGMLSLVQEWVAHPEDNYGIIITSEGGNTLQQLVHSANCDNPIVRPQFLIDYHLEGPAVPTSTPTPTPRMGVKTFDTYQVTTPPQIDGDLGEWTSQGLLYIDTQTADTAGPGSPQGISPTDISAAVRSRWDSNDLYFGIHVTDDIISVDNPTEPWHDDSIEIALDGVYDLAWGEGDYFLTCVADGRFMDWGGVASGITGATQRTSDGYDIEVAIPMAKLGSRPLSPGAKMGINIGIHDDDNGGSYDLYLIWSGNSTQGLNQSGELVFRGTANEAPTPTKPATVTATSTSQPASTASSVPTSTPTRTGTATPSRTFTPTATDIPTRTATPEGQIVVQTFQQGLQGYEGAQDTYIDAWYPTLNRGEDQRLVIRTGNLRSAMLRYELASIPTNAEILGARLAIHSGSPSGNEIQIQLYRVLKRWLEFQATWRQARSGVPWGLAGCNSSGQDRQFEPENTIPVSGGDAWYEFDIAPMVQSWVTLPASNYGLLLKGDASIAAEYIFSSSDEWRPDWRPKLTVTYRIPVASAASDADWTEQVLADRSEANALSDVTIHVLDSSGETDLSATPLDAAITSPGLADQSDGAELDGHFPAGYPTVVPVIYVMFDYNNRDYRLERPDYGPLGSWMWWNWDDIDKGEGQYDWSQIDTYLAKAAGMTIQLESGEMVPKPVAISIELYPGIGMDRTPEWIYRRFIPSAPEVDGNLVGRTADPDGSGACPPIGGPRWGDPVWEEQFKDLVMALGERYSDDPRVNSVWINTGLYGELISSFYSCGKTYNLDHGGDFGRWALRLMDVYRQAFPTKPVYMINSGRSYERYATTQKALTMNPKMGVKHNTLNYDLPNEYGKQSVAGFGLMESIAPYSTTLPIGFEHYFAGLPHQTYWATMNGLAHHADLFDFPYYPYEFHILDAIAALNNLLHGYDQWDFIDRYLGKSIETTPGVWIMFRDTQWPVDVLEWNGSACVPRAWESGEDNKDWGYWIKRVDAPGGKALELVRPLDINKGHTECWQPGNFRWQSELPASLTSSIYGYYSLRRTDEATGNRYFYLDVADTWPHWGKKPKAAGGTESYRVTVNYADLGTDTWSLVYTRYDGTTRTLTVKKGDTQTWEAQTWVLDDMYLHNGLNQGDDLRLDSMGDGNDYFHLVHVESAN